MIINYILNLIFVTFPTGRFLLRTKMKILSLESLIGIGGLDFKL